MQQCRSRSLTTTPGALGDQPCGQRPTNAARGTGDNDPASRDTIFEVLVRDFSALAVELHGKASSTDAQQQWALANVHKPVIDTGRFERVWEQVVELSDAYLMKP